jgi:RNA polymerase-binding transcription factor DksA
MTTRRGWRAWLAAAVPVGLAGLATLTFGRGTGGSFLPPRDPGGPASTRALASAAHASRPGLPRGRANHGPAGPGAQAAGTPEDRGPSLLLPAWRTLLETRWQQRLSTVTTLSLAYHDAADRPDGGDRVDGQPGSRELRRLMQEAVAARRALSDTEEALARLSAGTYGRCEQCTAAIPAVRLLQEPEVRYCECCVLQAVGKPEALPA